jgi:hypothetical protein
MARPLFGRLYCCCLRENVERGMEKSEQNRLTGWLLLRAPAYVLPDSLLNIENWSPALGSGSFLAFVGSGLLAQLYRYRHVSNPVQRQQTKWVVYGITAALTGQAQSEVVTVVSTLIIAALFSPLRRRVQAIIDQRFYRRRYDARQTLAAFSEVVRNEVELDNLSNELLGFIRETLQPAEVTLWLKPAEEKGA